MKSILVIGMGTFGRHLACELAELGNEVMIVDREESYINELAPHVTVAQIGDCRDPQVIEALGVSNFDLCFVCIGDDFLSALEITSLIKDAGAQHVVSKATSDVHAKFLLRNGADEVIYPERDMAHRSAVRYGVKNTVDYIELTQDYSIFEIDIPDSWVGKTPGELAIRARYGLNIIATKLNGNVSTLTSADYVFRDGEHLIIAGDKKAADRLLDRHR